jgi:hypothetical protein
MSSSNGAAFGDTDLAALLDALRAAVPALTDPTTTRPGSVSFLTFPPSRKERRSRCAR